MMQLNRLKDYSEMIGNENEAVGPLDIKQGAINKKKKAEAEFLKNVIKRI